MGLLFNCQTLCASSHCLPHNLCSSSESQVACACQLPQFLLRWFTARTTLVVQERREHVTDQAVRLMPCYLPRGPIPDQWNTKVSDHERTEPGDWRVEGLSESPAPTARHSFPTALGFLWPQHVSPSHRLCCPNTPRRMPLSCLSLG